MLVQSGPHTRKTTYNVDKIESVQKRATKQIPGFNNLSYHERLKKLKLPTIAYRRIRGDMIDIYYYSNVLFVLYFTNFLP
jgi:hypothetical protein